MQPDLSLSSTGTKRHTAHHPLGCVPVCRAQSNGPTATEGRDQVARILKAPATVAARIAVDDLLLAGSVLTASRSQALIGTAPRLDILVDGRIGLLDCEKPWIWTVCAERIAGESGWDCPLVVFATRIRRGVFTLPSPRHQKKEQP